MNAIASIWYAGHTKPIEGNIHLSGTEYQALWTIPWNAQTGRYEVDLTLPDGKSIRRAGSFAVHRQLAKVIAFDLDKTFYTAGDAVNPRIVVRNISNQRLQLQVEFEAYTYPWDSACCGREPELENDCGEIPFTRTGSGKGVPLGEGGYGAGQRRLR
ncbi:MAG: hypothetical protein ACR2JB_17985 [Bryobacteraceae bacterium]